MQVDHLIGGADTHRQLEKSCAGGDEGLGLAKGFMAVEIMLAVCPFGEPGHGEKLASVSVTAQDQAGTGGCGLADSLRIMVQYDDRSGGRGLLHQFGQGTPEIMGSIGAPYESEIWEGADFVVQQSKMTQIEKTQESRVAGLRIVIAQDGIVHIDDIAGDQYHVGADLLNFLYDSFGVPGIDKGSQMDVAEQGDAVGFDPAACSASGRKRHRSVQRTVSRRS